MQAIGIGRPIRQDTFDLRDQIQSDDNSHIHSHVDNNITYGGTSDEEHSVLEDDSDAEDREVDYMDEDDDGSSILSIPNESIDFDLVYSLHSFAATVEGQANVVKGDSLFLMDDSNSYWWLVRVLKTQEVGYIPAENIETPFERLARLNKHRNVDVSIYKLSSAIPSSNWFYDSSHRPRKQNYRKTCMHLGIDFETTSSLPAMVRALLPPSPENPAVLVLGSREVFSSHQPFLCIDIHLRFGAKRRRRIQM